MHAAFNDSIQPVIRRFHVAMYVALFAMLTLFWPLVSFAGSSAWLFALAGTASYSALYLLPVVVINFLLGKVLPTHRSSHAWRMWLRYAVAMLGGSAALLAIYADYRLYALYQYHFNGFVWNLLTTPGGIAALGATSATERTVALQVMLITAAVGVTLGVLHAASQGRCRPRRGIARFMVAMMLLLTGVELTYAYSTYTGREALLLSADVIPFHLRSSGSKLMKALGVEHTAMKQLRVAGGVVDYPGHKLQARTVKEMPNVVMLVAESFRWDLLSPEITPNLWRLSERGMRFENHYSGGNRTRMGLFSLFYGLYAPYWYSFESQRVAPAFMNFLREKNYQLAAHTSQSFNYPELRNTVFSGVPEENLREIMTGAPWSRDVQNIDELIGKLDTRDKHRPFYDFMFFESTHAAYSFPEETVLRSDYVRELDYVTLDLANNIKGIHARYINAAHHIDQQVGRLLESLEARGLMDKTVILFTGDHGEEFMEKGHWGHGHGSTFPEEQIRVPLVLWLPGSVGSRKQVITHRTSHLQVAPTLLEFLGVTAPSRSYSSADPLTVPMNTFVLGEYDYMAIMDQAHKITFPFTGTDFFRYRVSDANDNLVERTESTRVIEAKQAMLDAAIKESSRFLKQ
ncbi:MAG: sulfatase-like hydrolase/transferase [Rhodocyclaceae bacterium]|nr:sulfatase-like hydrolase/transferase [Rhodocyclaceae bacterium]